jgi:hypothetical protein
MEPGLDVPFDRPDPLRECLRPAAIWLGLAAFFVGALALGATLAARQSGAARAFTGPVLLLLGVALVGGGFTMSPTEFRLDPDIEFDGRRRYLVAGSSALLLAVAAGAMLLAAV